jgi:DeoR/GlpR family transcriptional regulator of sugar metabolism
MQKAFVSCSGFSIERGMTEVHLAGAHLKRKVILSAQQVIALVGSNKLGKEDLTSFANIDQIDQLFTDDGLSDEWHARLDQVGMPVTICSEDRRALLQAGPSFFKKERS